MNSNMTTCYGNAVLMSSAFAVRMVRYNVHDDRTFASSNTAGKRSESTVLLGRSNQCRE